MALDFGVVQRRQCQFSRQCRVGVQNLVQRQAVCKVFEKNRNRNARSAEDRRSTKNFRVDADNIVHGIPLAVVPASLQNQISAYVQAQSKSLSEICLA